MASLRNFECVSCGYESRLVAGGRDAIMAGETSTVSCRECRELYDVLVYDVRKENKEPERAEIEASCPVSKPHLVEEWNHPGSCPECGEILSEGGKFLFVD